MNAIFTYVCMYYVCVGKKRNISFNDRKKEILYT